MTTEEYRKASGCNFSTLKHLLKSPAHYKAALDDQDDEESEAMAIGTLAHAMVLEGKDLRDLYAIKPAGMSFSTKEGKAWRDQQTLPILGADAAEGIPRIAAAIKANDYAAAILKGCPMRETPIFGTIMGVPCKVLIDCHGIQDRRAAVTDFKTTVDASPREFAKNAYKQHYDLQCAISSALVAMQHELDEPPFWSWIVTEKKAPFVNTVYVPTEEFIQSGIRKMERVLTLWKECTESGEWPMPMKGRQELDLPQWAKYDAA